MVQAGDAGFAYKPLYVQVRDSLVRRLIDGLWQPGQMIPSEIDLAREVGVSQGTIRKALDAMTAENLLVRRQGRGTYVAEPEDGRILFQYFRLTGDDGARIFPTSTVLRWSREHASVHEAATLGLDPGAAVFRIARIRAMNGLPTVVETISLGSDRFAGLDALPEIPNNVYRLYSERWGITIGRAREKLKAVAATPGDAESLGCAPSTPLLEIDRLAYDLENNPVELRLSRCLTENVHYLSELR